MSCRPDSETGEAWLCTLLRGLTTLQTSGTPGSIVVYGDRAEPILTASGVKDVVMAAAEVGKGRMVIMSHNSYVVNFAVGEKHNAEYAQLQSNIKMWLTGDCERPVVHLSNKSKIGQLANEAAEELPILLWSTGPMAQSEQDALRKYVHDGGAYVHAMCPWGWLQLNPGKTLEDMPNYGLMEDAGVCYTEKYVNGNFDAQKNQARDAHVGKILEVLDKEPDKINTQGDVAGQLRDIPRMIGCQLLKKHQHLFDKLKQDMKICFPSERKPVNQPKERAVMAFLEVLKPDKMPGVEHFPGDFAAPQQLLCAEIKVASSLQDAYPTGLYLPPGGNLKIEILNRTGSDSHKWSVQIGAHCDNLSSQASLKRWPQIVISTPLPAAESILEVSSPYGGLVYLFSPKEMPTSIHLRISGVVKSPLFDLRDKESVAEWAERRHSPGLWADMKGELITITVPSVSVQQLDHPAESLRLWDQAVAAHNDLRGTSPQAGRTQWVVADIQPSAGYMHSGYPIVTHLDITIPNCAGQHDSFIFDAQRMVSHGNWGLFHELGHNMQRPAWTFDGTGEVTCNIFTLHAMEVICGIKPLDHSWVRNQFDGAKKYLESSAPFAQWKAKPGVALCIYAQIAHHFGWGCYKEVFRKYEAMQGAEVPKDDQEKIDAWFTSLSVAVQHDLSPLLELWGIPFSASAHQQTCNMSPFLPKDVMFELCLQRSNSVCEHYPHRLVHGVCTPQQAELCTTPTGAGAPLSVIACNLMV